MYWQTNRLIKKRHYFKNIDIVYNYIRDQYLIDKENNLVINLENIKSSESSRIRIYSYNDSPFSSIDKPVLIIEFKDIIKIIDMVRNLK